jgi:hypothetical protein
MAVSQLTQQIDDNRISRVAFSWVATYCCCLHRGCLNSLVWVYPSTAAHLTSFKLDFSLHEVFLSTNTNTINQLFLQTMAASTASAPLLLNPVKVNIRLCGSIPREEMGSFSVIKTTPFEFEECSSLHTIENKLDSMESLLCSQLSKMQQQELHTIPLPALRQVSNSFEAPSWAVPASGEARLEVSGATDLQASLRDLFPSLV